MKERNDVTILSTGPRLDVVTERKLRESAREIAQAGRAKLVIDMKQTAFIDSKGLQALVELQKLFHECHGEMRIAEPSAQVRSLLQLTRIDMLLEIHQTVDSAVSSFA